MNGINSFQGAFAAIVFIGVVLLVYHLWLITTPTEAQAQEIGPSATLQERQVRALETIANEMARMRRECR